MNCTYCGQEMRAGDAFCQNCGVRFRSESSEARGNGNAPVAPPPRMPVKTTIATIDYPKLYTSGWAVLAAIITACVMDFFLIRYDRGVNILIVGAAAMAMWLVPMIRNKMADRIPVFPAALFAMMNGSMFFQACGPVDTALYPFWEASFIYFAVSCRNRLLGLEGKPLNPLSYRWGSMNAATDFRRIVSSAGDNESRKKASHIALGLVVSAPIAGVIIMLLSQADKAFESFLGDMIENLSTLYVHVPWTVFLFIVFFVSTSLLVLAEERKTRANAKAPDAALPLLSQSVILISLAAVIGAFLAVHLKTLLLSEKEILALTGMPYYVYIRRGFAELLAVEAIIGAALVWVIHTDSWREEAKTQHHVLGWVLILLTALLSVSCGMRLWYYVTEYGLTLVRSLNAVGVLVSFVCLAFVAVRVVRPATMNQSEGVIFRIFLTAYVLWSCTMPVRIIAEYNVEKQLEGRHTEMEYLSYLGPDAYPALSKVLVRGQGALSTADRSVLTDQWVKANIDYLSHLKWMEWNPTTQAALRGLKRVDVSKL